jgi:transposase InsO family protein
MALTGVDQLWRADITYIRLREESVFLAVIVDAYTRRVIGWALDRTMEDDLTLTALRMALSRRTIEPGLIHHSDRGSQYASGDYTDLLKARQIGISMSRKGNPWDNAASESFIKTLKYEEVPRNEYAIWLKRARPSTSSWSRRSAICRRPSSSESHGAEQRGCRCAAAFFMSFPRHGEIYPSDGSA